MEKTYTIYTISLQGKVMYVGKTCGYRERKRKHLKYRGNTRHSSIPTDVNLDLIEFNILEEVVGKDEALRVEGRYILEYKTLQEQGGWNIHKSGLIKRDNKNEYTRIGMKKYRDENREHYREVHNAWLRKYYQDHKEEECERNKKKMETNREEYNAHKRNWYQEHIKNR